MNEPQRPATVVIGAGPAGLTAAYQLAKRGAPVSVFEADYAVGGISRTVERDGWRFDIGGHRFFTKVAQVEALWHEILPDEDFLLRPRMSRIYYRGKLYDYPLKAMNALRNLGVGQSLLAVGSYARSRIRPPKDQSNYENWLGCPLRLAAVPHVLQDLHREGLGHPGQRHAGRLGGAAHQEPVAVGGRDQRDHAEAQSDGHHQPHRGVPVPEVRPGMMWEVAAEKVGKFGGTVAMATGVTAIHREGDKAVAVTVTDADGSQQRVPADHVISSMPMSALLKIMDPPPPAEVIEAADDLQYRDFLTVALVVPEEFSFPDNWIYIHDPASRSAGSRTSARGRRTWSRKGAPAWAWSTSSSRATTCGPGPTRT